MGRLRGLPWWTRRCIPSRHSAWFPRRPRSPRSSTQWRFRLS